MPSFVAPARDSRFIINEVLRIGDLAELPGFEGASADIVDAVIEEAGKFASEVLAPLIEELDQQGCSRQQDADVMTP